MHTYNFIVWFVLRNLPFKKIKTGVLLGSQVHRLVLVKLLLRHLEGHSAKSNVKVALTNHNMFCMIHTAFSLWMVIKGIQSAFLESKDRCGGRRIHQSLNIKWSCVSVSDTSEIYSSGPVSVMTVNMSVKLFISNTDSDHHAGCINNN